ncbi:winged helix-turn-helix transcriptional regulator [Kribbella deserti]|uniref:Winged helix-turn-helix transcriptional regulator n=1 Tax=Kribbella deserti TaxID=1926257 RepID=A0ABV6QFP8_9ACTN
MKFPLSDSCGLGPALRVIGGRWKSVLIWELHEGPVRFGELRRRAPGISEKVLMQQLRELEADGVVSRHVVREKPLWVEYELTPAGQKLNDAVHTLALWGQEHAPSHARTG